MIRPLLAALLLAGSAAADPLPDTGMGVRVASVASSLSGTEAAWSCPADMAAAYAASGLPSGDRVETLRAIDRHLRSRIRYREDPDGDIWTNHASRVLRGERVAGDCDDFALAAISLALCAGVPAEKMGLALAHRGRGRLNMQSTNHVFAFYADGSRTLAVADTFRDRVGEVISRRDRVTFWQSVPEMRKAPDMFRAAAPPPPGS